MAAPFSAALARKMTHPNRLERVMPLVYDAIAGAAKMGLSYVELDEPFTIDELMDESDSHILGHVEKELEKLGYDVWTEGSLVRIEWKAKT